MVINETIVAVATPPGRGGLGVIRLSGAHAIEIAEKMIRLAKTPLEAQRASVGWFDDPESGKALDEVVVTCFRRPHSYTGEDVVEISCHGAPVVLGYLIGQCLKEGARPAEPGEFTLRAFMNGRMDLTQAEAVRDLIEARTLHQARVAAAQLEGAVSARLKPHKQALLEVIAGLEAGIDFADDDVPMMAEEEIRRKISAVRADLEKFAAGFSYGRVVREGLSLSIVGRPNVGKSSLFNRLLEEDRAIVTAEPGTTRDLVSETVAIEGIPLRFVDTAGIRETTEEVERIGVKRSHQAMADADLRLLVVDASAEWSAEDAVILSRTLEIGPLLIALNKSDLPAGTRIVQIERALDEARCDMTWPTAVVSTSALTGAGIEELRKKIVEIAAPGGSASGEDALITNLRHAQLLLESLAALEKASRAAESRVHHEMLLLDLYDALRPLDALTGATDVENILGIIFSKFCIGK